MSTLVSSVQERKNSLVNDIEFMINALPEQLSKIFFSSMSTYFRALTTFGRNSEITRSSLTVLRDMFKIGKQEKVLLKYILNNLDRFNLSATELVVDKLDELNEKTYKAYDKVFADIEDACDTKDPNRFGKHHTIDSLISNETYSNMVYALNAKDDNIRHYLGYPDEFWEFIQSHLRVVPYFGEIDKKHYGITPIMDKENTLVDFFTIVPSIVNYESIKVAVDVYRKAYQYYQNVGKKISDVYIFESDSDINQLVSSLGK